jgi:phosphoglycolate phosphatase
VPDLAVAINAMLMAANLPLAGEPQVRDWVGNGAKVLVEHALAFAYQCDRAEVARDELRYQYQQFLVFYRESSSQQSHLYKGVAPALQHWRRQGLKMAVVTNKPAEFITPLLERFNLQDYFSVLVGGDTLLQQKPDPAPIQYACKELDLSVDQCIMIGDSCTDVGAARAANMTVACVSYGYNHGVPIEETRPDIVVDSLSDLIV